MANRNFVTSELWPHFRSQGQHHILTLFNLAPLVANTTTKIGFRALWAHFVMHTHTHTQSTRTISLSENAIYRYGISLKNDTFILMCLNFSAAGKRDGNYRSLAEPSQGKLKTAFKKIVLTFSFNLPRQISYSNLHLCQNARLVSLTSPILAPPNLHLSLFHEDPSYLASPLPPD